MKRKFFARFLVVAFLAVGCGAPATASPLPVESPTLTAQPTHTPRPTATRRPPTPTLTPEPGLRTSGPYFAYFQEVNGIRRLVFMDADGEGRKVIELPEAINDSFAIIKPLDLDMRSVSPDGHWFAFHTGSAGNYGEMPAQGTSDLSLNLLDLTTGEEQVVTPLLSKDYPDNFVEAAGKLNDPDITAQSLHDAFISGITEAVAWSPDGRYLAFAGQMDGLSSDLYVYDVNEKTIRRLSSGDQELQWISWSPDGKWILHGSVFWVGAGMTFDIYTATVDGSLAPYISTNILYDGIENWLNAHQYFENDGENGPGEYGLRLVDIDTGGITRIWDGSFRSYAVDKNGMWVSILAASPDAPPKYDNGYYVYDYDSDFVPGIYLINLATLEKSRVEVPGDHDFYGVASFGLGGREFVISDGAFRNANAMFLSTNGALTQTDLGDVKIYVSPNSGYWLAITTITSINNQNFLVIDGQYVKIFSADNALIRNIPLFSPENIFISNLTWRPDSSGLFFISGTEIFSMNIPSGEIKVVEPNLSDNYGEAALRYKWVNVQ